ncbi:TPA: hypothetical protein MJA80_24715 [Klebsiella pneumoniae]|uniref:Uncharacterized protein n=1 Tax=Salmonella enterica subsp. enterica serovar Poona TaxID=436295 RepID=A0A731YGW6_SALET|nr:hypothetical protein [Salmonella enterica subsp. enterica serovar Poona]HBZ0075236.1 hypothetical protein [Klebsiella pneumoniae]HBZ0085571.1 hypothetical protein [Klebsiella pneumoniae]
MLNITFSMILCVWFDYHILCAFPAAQIRFLAVPDLLPLPGGAAAQKHKICHSLSCVFFYI